jgi:hypothetical protein
LYPPLAVTTALRGRQDDDARWEQAADGLHGLLYHNSVIDMDTAALGDSPTVPRQDLRQLTGYHLGWICAGWTPHSGEAGVLMRLCHGVRLRLWDWSFAPMLDLILSPLRLQVLLSSRMLKTALGAALLQTATGCSTGMPTSLHTMQLKMHHSLM